MMMGNRPLQGSRIAAQIIMTDGSFGPEIAMNRR